MTGSERRGETARRARAQTTLPALAVALVLVTVLAGLGLSMADGAITGASRTPDERRAAAAIADHLVTTDGPLADRANVLNDSRVQRFDSDALRRTAPPAREYAVRVALDGRTVAETGSTVGGTTIHRLVLVETTTTHTLRPSFDSGATVTLPRRTRDVTLALAPPNGTRVWTVKSNARVRLHNDSGLTGRFQVSTVPYETTTLRFFYAGSLAAGDVIITSEAPRTTKARLTVTVDA